MLRDAGHGVVVAGVGEELLDCAIGIAFAESRDFFLIGAVGTERASRMGVDARGDERKSPLRADVAKQEFRRSGYHEVSWLGIAWARDFRLMDAPKALNLGFDVWYAGKEPVERVLERRLVYEMQCEASNGGDARSRQRGDNARMSAHAPLQEIRRGISPI